MKKGKRFIACGISAAIAISSLTAFATEEEPEYTQDTSIEVQNTYDTDTAEYTAELTTESVIDTAVDEDISYYVKATATLQDEVAHGICGDDLTWTLDNSGTLTISGSGCINSYYDSYNELTYTSYKDQIVNLVIEDGITSIGNLAFKGFSNMISVTIADSVTDIGDSSFMSCSSLNELKIGSGVTTIGSSAFSDCISLTDVTIPNNVTKTEYGIFQNCTALKTVTLPNSLTHIAQSMFQNCECLSSINIPDSVTYIEDNAFKNCTALSSISIPDSVTYIDSEAFYGCSSLNDPAIPDSVTYIGENAYTNTEYYNDPTNRTDSLLYYGNFLIAAYPNDTIGEISVKAGTTVIADCVFADCGYMTVLMIPDSVILIGRKSFYNGGSLTDLYYGGTKEQWLQLNIESKNFLLTNTLIHFGSGDNNIAWLGCGSLGDNLTWVIDENGTLMISGSGEMYNSSYSGSPFYNYKDAVVKVIIEDGITSIGDYSFKYCVNLTDITIPDSVTSIGCGAFDECMSLTGITIPDSVVSISESAFYGCTALNSIDIPDGVVSIGEKAFKDCTALSDIKIPDSMTSIGASAFYGTAYYNNDENWDNGILYIGNALIKAENADITGEAYIKEGTRIIGDLAFEYCTNMSGVKLTDSVNYIGFGAFYGCSGLKSIVIPDSAESIGSSVFEGCYSLIDVTLPDNTTSIVCSEFNGCSSLKSIIIPVGVKYIDSYAFDDCYDLEDVYYKGSSSQWSEIEISYGNICLTDASIHFDHASQSSSPEYNVKVNASKRAAENGTSAIDIELSASAVGELIVAQYDDNGRLISLKKQETNENSTAYTEEVPNEEDSSVKVMLWNGVSSMNELAEAVDAL